MKRLQLRHHNEIFQGREEAVTFIKSLTAPEHINSVKFGGSKQAEPLVVEYYDEEGNVQVMLAIGKSANDSGTTENPGYHIIDSFGINEEFDSVSEELAEQSDEISNLGENIDAVNGRCDGLLGNIGMVQSQLNDEKEYRKAIKLVEIDHEKFEDLRIGDDVRDAYFVTYHKPNSTEPYEDPQTGDAIIKVYKDEVTENDLRSLELNYDSDNKDIILNWRVNGHDYSTSIDASDFLVDGVLTRVEFDEQNKALVFVWNDTDSTRVSIPLSSLSNVYNVASGSVTYLKINGNEVSALVDNEAGYSKTLATTQYVDNATSGTSSIVGSINALSGAVETLNGDKDTNGSVMHIVDDKFSKDIIYGGLIATDITLEEARQHSLLRKINIGGEEKYYASSNAEDMLYAKPDGTYENLNNYLRRLENTVSGLEATVSELNDTVSDLERDNSMLKSALSGINEYAANLQERVTALENASIDESAVKDIIKSYIVGTSKEIKVSEDGNNLKVGFADDAIFGDYLATL